MKNSIIKVTLLIAVLFSGAAYSQSSSPTPFYERSNQKWGYKDPSGNIIVPPIYDSAGEFHEGMAKVGTPDPDELELGKWGFIDATGKLVVPMRYNYADDFSEGLACVGTDSKLGYIDKTGKPVIPLKYFLDPFSPCKGRFVNGLAPVGYKSGFIQLYGFIDKTDKLVIPFKYIRADNFSEGLAAVFANTGKLGGNMGFIDPADKVVISFQYDSADEFHNGAAKVTLNNREFYIDKTGKEVMFDPAKVAGDWNATFKYEANNTMANVILEISKAGNIAEAYIKDPKNTLAPVKFESFKINPDRSYEFKLVSNQATTTGKGEFDASFKAMSGLIESQVGDKSLYGHLTATRK